MTSAAIAPVFLCAVPSPLDVGAVTARGDAERFSRSIALGAQEGLGWRTLDSRELLALEAC